MTAYSIYLVTCPHGRHYVGCTKGAPEERFRKFERGVRAWPGDASASLSDAITRFGRAAFSIRTLATAGNIADAAAVETLMIERYGALSPRGYNAMRTSHYVLRDTRPARLRTASHVGLA